MMDSRAIAEYELLHGYQIDNNSPDFYFRHYFERILLNRKLESCDKTCFKKDKPCGRNEHSSPDSYYLLKSKIRGANVNGPINKLGETPLMQALKLAMCQSIYAKFSPVYSSRDHYSLVKFLLENGASITEKDSSGFMPIEKAVCKTRLHALEALLNTKGIKNVINHLLNDEYSSMICNAYIITFLIVQNNEEAFRHFLNNRRIDLDAAYLERFNVDKKYFGGPLHAAISKRSPIKTIDFLVEFGADVNLVNPEKNMTPLHVLCSLSVNKKTDYRFYCYLFEIVEHLLSLKADINAIDIRRRTPLRIAVKNFDRTNELLKCRKSAYYRSIPELLVAHIGKMVAGGENVRQENMIFLNKHPIISVIYKQVQKEIDDLEVTIDKHTQFSYYYIFMTDIDLLGRILERTDLLPVVEQKKFRFKYPIFSREMREKILKAKYRRTDVQVASEIFRKYVKPNLPFDVLFKIWKLINPDNLNNFLCAFHSFDV